jgi:putative FmdB family regulatory protein
MAVYEYLCPKCRDQFELIRPMSEAEKPARCPKCGSEAQKMISGFTSEVRDSIQPAGDPFSERTVVGEDGLERYHVERREMPQESLLQMLEDLASKVRLLELEKRQATARAQALEREVGKLAALITLAGEKVEEILKVGAKDDVSQQKAVNAQATSPARERLGEVSADPQREPNERSSRAWRSD